MNAAKQRLHGWKEIAFHFSRSVRCVQRGKEPRNYRSPSTTTLAAVRSTRSRKNSKYAEC